MDSIEHGEGELFDPAEHRPTRKRLFALGGAVTAVLALLAVAGAVPRAERRAATETKAKELAAVVPRVQVVKAQRVRANGPVTLPGTIEPLRETAIYARANGYVRKWFVDIGAEVKQGQVLADLDLPDVEQELRQAQANARQANAGITQAQSRLEFAKTTNDRFNALTKSGVASQQQADQSASDFLVNQADVVAAHAASGSAQANLQRVQDLRNFGTLVAPFDGVITLRDIELGQLVVSGTGQGKPLFKVAQDDVVRVFVNVPQLYASGVKPGLDAPVTVRELQGRTFPGKVARTARELDSITRSMRVEIDIPNPDRALVSGMYAKAAIAISRQDNPLTIPASALRIDASGTRVALVRQKQVHWQTVEVRGDLGDRLMIANGLTENDELITAPSERLGEGRTVQAELVQPAQP